MSSKTCEHDSRAPGLHRNSFKQHVCASSGAVGNPLPSEEDCVVGMQGAHGNSSGQGPMTPAHAA
eukprot:14540318-Alexandrium_andersonii.AAC.1